MKPKSMSQLGSWEHSFRHKVLRRRNVSCKKLAERSMREYVGGERNTKTVNARGREGRGKKTEG